MTSAKRKTHRRGVAYGQGMAVREFFNGWKCKVGVATLLMAFVFTAGFDRWIESVDWRHQRLRITRLIRSSELFVQIFVRTKGRLRRGSGELEVERKTRMKVHVQTAYDPSRWIMRKTVGHKVIVNDEIIYTSETGCDPGCSQLDLHGGSRLILKRGKKDDSKNWSMLRDGTEIARIAHRYGIAYADFYDVMTCGVTYKSFSGLSSLSKDKSFYKGVGRWGDKFWFIDEIGFEVAAMLALYETCVIWTS